MTVKRVLAAAAALALVTPASAQESSSDGAKAADNLDCAIWASFQVGAAQDEKVQNGFAIALGWFIGLYEGEVGEPIDDAMASRTAEMEDADIDALTAGCLARFGAFGERLQALSKRIDAQSGQERQQP